MGVLVVPFTSALHLLLSEAESVNSITLLVSILFFPSKIRLALRHKHRRGGVHILPISLKQQSLRDVDGEETNKTELFH